MRFQCLEVTCGKQFGWTAKKIIKVSEVETIEYVVCPYCGGLDFDELAPNHKIPQKKTPPIKYPTPVQPTAGSSQFDPADLMQHKWKGKKRKDGGYEAWNGHYGWDFKDQFVDATLNALEKGSVTVDKYIFSLKGKLVSVSEAKPK